MGSESQFAPGFHLLQLKLCVPNRQSLRLRLRLGAIRNIDTRLAIEELVHTELLFYRFSFLPR